MESSKERRNLVFLSTAVILFWWLDLPEGIVFEKIFGAKIENNISQWKVWLAIFLVLLYQIHRFHSLLDTHDTWKEFCKDRKKFTTTIISHYISYLYSRKITSKKLIEYSPVYKNLETEGNLEHYEFSFANIGGEIPEEWSGLINVKRRNHLNTLIHQKNIYYRLPPITFKIAGALSIFFITRKIYFTEFAIPIALGVISAIYAITRAIIFFNQT